MQSHILLALVLSAFVASAAPGQVEPPKRDSVVGLPGVSVTATRRDASILRTPLAISKITAAELRSANGYGIEDALARRHADRRVR